MAHRSNRPLEKTAASPDTPEEQAPADPLTIQLQRFEVTGSAIRRVDAETAVPISVLRAEERRDRPLEARRQRHLEPRRLAGHPEQPLHQRLQRLQRLRPRQPRKVGSWNVPGPGRQLPPQPCAGADPRGEEPARPRTAVQQTYTFQSGYDPRYTAPTGASCLAASTTAGRPAAVAGKPVDGCPAARSGSPARFHRRPDLAGCWVPGAMQPITPLAPHPFAQEDTA